MSKFFEFLLDPKVGNIVFALAMLICILSLGYDNTIYRRQLEAKEKELQELRTKIDEMNNPQ